MRALKLLLIVAAIAAASGVAWHAYHRNKEIKNQEKLLRKAGQVVIEAQAALERALADEAFTLGQAQTLGNELKRQLDRVSIPDSDYEEVTRRATALHSAIETGRECVSTYLVTIDLLRDIYNAQTEMRRLQGNIQTYSDNPYIVGGAQRDRAALATTVSEAQDSIRMQMDKMSRLRAVWRKQSSSLEAKDN